MTDLYNAKPSGDGYRMTKFDSDLNPVGDSSYILLPSSFDPSGWDCSCPASPRPICRHREMLPEFLTLDRADGTWMCEYDKDLGAIEWRNYVGPFGEDEGEESVEGFDDSPEADAADDILARERISGGYIPFESEKLADAIDAKIKAEPAPFRRRV